MMIIYKAINRINGKIYIGHTVQGLKDRITEHSYNRKNYPFPSAIRKYGRQNFEFSIIDNASLREISYAKEQYWIGQYGCMVPRGYNLTDGGEGTNGYHFTDEARKKISIALTGKKRPDVSERNRKGVLEETRRKISAAMTGEKGPNWGRTPTEETRTKISLAKIGVKHRKYCEVLA